MQKIQPKQNKLYISKRIALVVLSGIILSIAFSVMSDTALYYAFID